MNGSEYVAKKRTNFFFFFIVLMVMCIVSKCAQILCQMQFIRNTLKNNVSKSVQVKHKLQGKEIVSMFHVFTIIFCLFSSLIYWSAKNTVLNSTKCGNNQFSVISAVMLFPYLWGLLVRHIHLIWFIYIVADFTSKMNLFRNTNAGSLPFVLLLYQSIIDLEFIWP